VTAATLLHRQINPFWVQLGRVTSMAFRPTPKDAAKLSVYDGDQMTPEQAWCHFTGVQKLKSVGVRSVSVEECEQLGLQAVADPKPFPEHVVIDFSACESEGQRERLAKKLNRFAEIRGWLFEADSTS
jgi:hypothetical protein